MVPKSKIKSIGKINANSTAAAPPCCLQAAARPNTNLRSLGIEPVAQALRGLFNDADDGGISSNLKGIGKLLNRS
jgi:hypothetical protein